MNKTQRCCILSFCISLLHIFFPIPANATPVLEYKNFTAEGTERVAQLPALKFSAPVLAKTDKSTKDSSTSKKNSKTSSTDAQILAEIEKGTPASLRSAVSRVKQLGTKATDYENILFYVAERDASISTGDSPKEETNAPIEEIRNKGQIIMLFYNNKMNKPKKKLH